MTQRERRFVLGGAAAVLLILLGALIPRLLGGGEGDEPAVLQAERVARLRGLAASVDTLAAVARVAAGAERSVSARFLQGGTPQVAAAQLSAAVQELAEQSQLEVIREGVLAPTATGAATAVSLQVISRGDLPGLLEFLRGVEQAPLLLEVDELSVGADPRERPGVPTMTVTMRITGYTMQPAQDQEEP